MSKRNISQISDEGYNSDRSDRTENTTEKIRVLSIENRIFKEKYFVEKVINNSANGIIYKGKIIFMIKIFKHKYLRIPKGG